MPKRGKPLPETKVQRKAREASMLKDALTAAQLKRGLERRGK